MTPTDAQYFLILQQAQAIRLLARGIGEAIERDEDGPDDKRTLKYLIERNENLKLEAASLDVEAQGEGRPRHRGPTTAASVAMSMGETEDDDEDPEIIALSENDNPDVANDEAPDLDEPPEPIEATKPAGIDFGPGTHHQGERYLP